MTPEQRAKKFALPALLLFAAVIFCAGANWGLPSRRSDFYLFGGYPMWSGDEILRLAGGWGDRGGKGADVDADPLTAKEDPREPIVLNETDAQRAAIILRYRLYSHQPDEMITFRALAGMNPGRLHLDPKLYQYGGLWVYPVGALLRIGSTLGLIDLRSDLAYYIEHPEAFGRFYVVARLYSAAWGVVGAWAVFTILRKLTDGFALPTIGTLAYILLPVVVNMAHEAKPHLPGAVLMLLAVLAAEKYVEKGSRAWAIVAGAVCGLASGMVVSAAVIFIILPVMGLLRGDAWRRRFVAVAISVTAGVIVYAVTNPYVPIHLVDELRGVRTPLSSNLANSKAMYHASNPAETTTFAARWLAAGMTRPMALASAGAVLIHIGLLATGRGRRPHALAWLLAAPAAVVLVQFVLLAAGKPGEYARFALFADVVLVVAVMTAIARVVRIERWRAAVSGALAFSVAVAGFEYVAGFWRDVDPDHNSRAVAASDLQGVIGKAKPTVAVPTEPAPYSCPPIDVFDWRIVLPPKEKGGFPGADVTIAMQEDDRPISWASKGFAFINALSGMPKSDGR